MTTNPPTRASHFDPSKRYWTDHLEETARIQSAGGFVEFGRVNGRFALTGRWRRTDL